MRPLFHLGERESSRIVFGLKRSIGKNKSQSNTFWTRKIFCYAKLNATAEFLIEIQRESWSWRIFQSDYKLFISLFWCHRLGKHSEIKSEGLALLLRAGHPRKQIAIMSLVNSIADSKDHWPITITDEHLARSGRGRRRHFAELTYDQALEKFGGRLHEVGCSTTAKKNKLYFNELRHMPWYAVQLAVVNYYTEYFPFTLPP